MRDEPLNRGNLLSIGAANAPADNADPAATFRNAEPSLYDEPDFL